MAKKMPRKLVAVSATAIASIYLAGFMSTHGAADGVAAAAASGDPTTSTPVTAATATAAPAVVVGATAPPTTTSTTAASGYVDGTYSGMGTSRFGNVYVSVSIAGGAISNVQITKVTTSFPMSRIASLPAQVVQKQTSNVNSVSGATYSSQAFKQAVAQALAAAK